MSNYAAPRTPIASGIRLRCGTCGKGQLFRAYLKFYDHCAACGQDFTIADTADGPAFFVGFLAMIIFAPLIIIPMLVFESPWAKFAGFSGVGLLCLMFVLILLPPFKGVFLNLQIQHHAGEGRFSYNGSHGVPPKNWGRQRAAQKKAKASPLAKDKTD